MIIDAVYNVEGSPSEKVKILKFVGDNKLDFPRALTLFPDGKIHCLSVLCLTDVCYLGNDFIYCIMDLCIGKTVYIPSAFRLIDMVKCKGIDIAILLNLNDSLYFCRLDALYNVVIKDGQCCYEEIDDNEIL